MPMRVLFGAQDVLEIVNTSFNALAENTTDAQRNAHRKVKKKDQRALFFIHQCVDAKVFEKISKEVKLQSLRKQYVNLQMNSNEKVADYFS